MACLVVYIMEAHPVDIWASPDNVKQKINIVSPKNFDERCAVAETCTVKLSLRMPAVIDDMQNTTQSAYASHPDRLYLIDRDGRVAYKGNPGPYGFKPQELADALKRLVPESPTQAMQAR